MAPVSEGLPLWIQILIAIGTLVLGGGSVAAFFNYRASRQRNENDLLLGQLTHEGEEENSDANRWEKLTIAIAARQQALEGRVALLEAELATERREKMSLERKMNLQEIYIDRLIAKVTPPLPERPAGLV